MSHPVTVTDAVKPDVDMDEPEEKPEYTEKPKKSHKHKKDKVKKHHWIDVSIDGDYDLEKDVHIDHDFKTIDVHVGHDHGASHGHMMHDPHGKSYLNEVTPLYYYPNSY